MTSLTPVVGLLATAIPPFDIARKRPDPPLAFAADLEDLLTPPVAVAFPADAFGEVVFVLLALILALAEVFVCVIIAKIRNAG